MELELDAPALVCLLLPLVLLACYRATAARSDANPYHVGGFASLLVPFVAFLNSLERPPGTPGWVFRVLNRLDARVFATTGWRLVPVAEQELCALAESLERVGERDNTVKAVRLLCAELARPPCSATGRLVVQQWVRGLLHVRRACQDYVRRHPEIHDIKIEAPLFIIGPPRTASSFLLRLLSQDPNFRCPKFWEINAPVPPPEEATYATDPRIRLASTPSRPRCCPPSENFVRVPSLPDECPAALVRCRLTRRVDLRACVDVRLDFIGADEFEEDSLLLSYSLCFGMYFHVSPDAVSPFAQWMVCPALSLLCSHKWL
jgi:hypothetical protein